MERQPTRKPNRSRAPRRGGPSRWRGGIAIGALALIALLIALPAAQGAPIRRIGQNPRGLALGGTGMSYANDEMALYYNPAGLGTIDNWWAELLPIMLEASPDAISLVKDKVKSGSANVATLDDVPQLIRDTAGKDLHLRAMYYPTAIVNFYRGLTLGVGAFYEGEADVMIRNQAFPETDAFYRLDQGKAFGLSFPFREGQLLAGIGLRTIDREIGQGTITSARLIQLADSGEALDLSKELDVRKGTTMAYDLGFIWRMDSFARLRGQFAVVVQNIGEPSFGNTKQGKPEPIPQEVSLGWSFRPQVSPLFSTLFAVEFRDVGFQTTDDSSTEKRTHVGLEIGVIPMDVSTNLVTFRGGYGSGKVSYGVELALWHSFNLQYVVYSQEYGDRVGEDTRDRKILQINILGF